MSLLILFYGWPFPSDHSKKFYDMSIYCLPLNQLNIWICQNNILTAFLFQQNKGASFLWFSCLGLLTKWAWKLHLGESAHIFTHNSHLFSFISFREEKGKVPFLSGPQGTVAAKEIIVTVMVTQTASTQSPSAVLHSKAILLGMQRSVPQHWPQHTAAGTILTRKL